MLLDVVLLDAHDSLELEDSAGLPELGEVLFHELFLIGGQAPVGSLANLALLGY